MDTLYTKGQVQVMLVIVIIMAVSLLTTLVSAFIGDMTLARIVGISECSLLTSLIVSLAVSNVLQG